MKTSTKLAVAFVALAGVAGAALSAQADGRLQAGTGGSQPGVQQAYGGGDGHRGGHRFHGRKHHGGRHFLRMMESFDSDGDGRLSQEEVDNSRGERFTSFDGDGNETLSLEEYEQLWLDAMRERMVRAFQRLDRDGDAQVTDEEFKRPFSRMVRRMDRNDDGAIDREDFRRHRHHERNSDDNG